ncbi:MAG: UDP-N-acetylglucosamine--N-acetylmuramyl-(pentapeptide) pyrophosphoryl-undecaprenol N-acetylglucosamine transferase [Candidatus Sungbacteria bacterium]|nr:UDP-N-acetylglucosamine--N-acetylmuramyl-(pentapeptide) pyrophosphoryl-undecaprenol N-acetylglucosamine transferase [Candidatus Sungbacteria bacterium]
MRILFTGGGTGGHFFPIVAIARELHRIAEADRILNVELYYIGPDGFGRDVMLREEIIPDTIPAGKVRRYFSLVNFSDTLKTIWGVLVALWKLFVMMPDLVFSKGGYGSFPVLVVARLYHIPVIIHDSDAVPGLVSKWSAKFAKRIGVAFPGAIEYFPKEKTAVVGNPIRSRILGGIRENSREHLAVFSQKRVLLILGGSQGAEPINQMILSGLSDFVKEYEIIHQTGEKNFADVSQQANIVLSSETKLLYHPFPFLNETQLREALAACDLIIARASAGNIFEIAAAGKPSILIPLPHSAQDHQRANAYEYAKVSAALVVEQNNATPNLILHTLMRIFESPEESKKMTEGAQRFARIDAAEIIAREILNLALHKA